MGTIEFPDHKITTRVAKDHFEKAVKRVMNYDDSPVQNDVLQAEISYVSERYQELKFRIAIEKDRGVDDTAIMDSVDKTVKEYEKFMREKRRLVVSLRR